MSPKIHWNISKSSIFIFWLIFGGCQWQFEVDTEVFDVENPQRLQSSPCSVASPPRRSESAPPHPSGATGTSSFHWIIKTAVFKCPFSLAPVWRVTPSNEWPGISKPPARRAIFFSRLTTGELPGGIGGFEIPLPFLLGKTWDNQVETGSFPFLLKKLPSLERSHIPWLQAILGRWFSEFKRWDMWVFWRLLLMLRKKVFFQEFLNSTSWKVKPV